MNSINSGQKTFTKNNVLHQEGSVIYLFPLHAPFTMLLAHHSTYATGMGPYWVCQRRLVILTQPAMWGMKIWKSYVSHILIKFHFAFLGEVFPLTYFWLNNTRSYNCDSNIRTKFCSQAFEEVDQCCFARLPPPKRRKVVCYRIMLKFILTNLIMQIWMA